MIDLNRFVPPGSDLTLVEATFINDPGEISVQGTRPNGEGRAVLLIPCGEGTDGCHEAAEGGTATTLSNSASRAPSEMFSQLRDRFAHRYHLPKW